jgi:hypothetical protein
VAAEGVVGVAVGCGIVVVAGCCGDCAVVVLGIVVVGELEESPPWSEPSGIVSVAVGGSLRVIICGVGSSSPVSSPVARGSQGVPLKCSRIVALNCLVPVVGVGLVLLESG